MMKSYSKILFLATWNINKKKNKKEIEFHNKQNLEFMSKTVQAARKTLHFLSFVKDSLKTTSWYFYIILNKFIQLISKKKRLKIRVWINKKWMNIAKNEKKKAIIFLILIFAVAGQNFRFQIWKKKKKKLLSMDLWLVIPNQIALFSCYEPGFYSFFSDFIPI